MEIKYFPYAPGIPWRIKQGKYIVPKIEGEVWERSLEGRDIVLVGEAGFLEAYCSLYFLEACNTLYPGKNLYWMGNENLTPLYTLQGLAQKVEDTINLNDYPAPLFLDEEEYTFIYYTYNYMRAYSYDGNSSYLNKKPLLQQLFKNFLIPIDQKRYEPVWRYHQSSFETWCQEADFNIKNPYCLILPETTGLSLHTADCLQWDEKEVKEKVRFLEAQGIASVIATQSPGRYYGLRAKLIAPQVPLLLPLMAQAQLIFSKEIDFLLVPMMMTSKATLVGTQQNYKGYDLMDNKEKWGADNQIVVQPEISIEDISPIIKGTP